MKEVAIVLGVNADIGYNICKFLLADGFHVVGTFRRDFDQFDELDALPNTDLVRCDVTKKEDVAELAKIVDEKKLHWSLFFSSVGTSEPIGRFFDLEFDDWERSLNLNFTDQLRVLHSLYPLRSKTGMPDIALMAGGGTNNPFRCYSSYCIAKLALIKMCELIDDEAEDVNIYIFGPGFVRTKTHYETIAAGEMAEGNLERVKEFMASGDQGTEFIDIYRCMLWGREVGRQTVGGRNLSVVHDAWGPDELAFSTKGVEMRSRDD
jgi:NAD(P)-dependent dehydrogenase (short-subunit alcohol dehydrogenase family)